MILKNRKFDLRIWVVVTDWNPLTIWLFKKPYVRLPAHDYNADDIDNNYAHLANNSIAKYADQTKTKFENPNHTQTKAQSPRKTKDLSSEFIFIYQPTVIIP